MVNKAVFDTGPLLHLAEIDSLCCLDIFKQIIIPPEVKEELKKYKFKSKRKISVVKLDHSGKDLSKTMQERYDLDIGESETIALAKQEKIKLIFTDDLDARTVAKTLGFEVHGTLAIVTRAYSMKIITRKTAMEIVSRLYKDSSLFVTKDLVDWILKRF